MISIVIPVLDEEQEIAGCLERLAAAKIAYEAIVVDGGCEDRTRSIAETHGAVVVTSAPGRGLQMNTGAQAATGEILVFLHVDTVLPSGALPAIVDSLGDASVNAGGFMKSYDGGGWPLRITGSLLNHLRTRVFKRLVGTQAIFIRRTMFEKIGGFQDWPLLEDVEFSDRLRRTGGIVILPEKVTVSARRYIDRGVIRQILVNAMVLSLFRLGVSPHRLKQMYDGLR